ncbi:expressed unknown protein [Seminavis robusta]|uniref:Uncharacterized protein n=1 Tax=Seminavis robusta TaxID=568900 RepID=A0A9N8HDI5_9STRA|nr:expressed unknown protein [Seminavis robusta]|eukprot:Sro429_g141080.1 n/a (279) ;mRNA; f:32061-33348
MVRRKLLPLEGFGGHPNAAYLPLGECQGDCDSDDDCKGNLKCFERGPGDPVPGCEGGEEAMSRTDYCVSPSANTGSGGSDGASQRYSSSAQYEINIKPASEQSESLGQNVQQQSSTQSQAQNDLVGFGATPPNGKVLAECEGDCDNDQDCDDGLVCFQRGPGNFVPGCNGGQDNLSKSDFCVKKGLAAAVRNSQGSSSSATISFETNAASGGESSLYGGASGSQSHEGTNSGASPHGDASHADSVVQESGSSRLSLAGLFGFTIALVPVILGYLLEGY